LAFLSLRLVFNQLFHVLGVGVVIPYIASLFDSTLTWADLKWLAGITKLSILVKGILRSDDAHPCDQIRRLRPYRIQSRRSQLVSWKDNPEVITHHALVGLARVCTNTAWDICLPIAFFPQISISIQSQALPFQKVQSQRDFPPPRKNSGVPTILGQVRVTR
jgi:hypothetical protein